EALSAAREGGQGFLVLATSRPRGSHPADAGGCGRSRVRRLSGGSDAQSVRSGGPRRQRAEGAAPRDRAEDETNMTTGCAGGASPTERVAFDLRVPGRDGSLLFSAEVSHVRERVLRRRFLGATDLRLAPPDLAGIADRYSRLGHQRLLAADHGAHALSREPGRA